MKLQELFEAFNTDDDRFMHGFDSKPKLSPSDRRKIIKKKVVDASKKIDLKDAMSVDPATLELYDRKVYQPDPSKFIPVISKMTGVEPNIIKTMKGVVDDVEEIIYQRYQRAKRREK
jgi:hypothetical protein